MSYKLFGGGGGGGAGSSITTIGSPDWVELTPSLAGYVEDVDGTRVSSVDYSSAAGFTATYPGDSVGQAWDTIGEMSHVRWPLSTFVPDDFTFENAGLEFLLVAAIGNFTGDSPFETGWTLGWHYEDPATPGVLSNGQGIAILKRDGTNIESGQLTNTYGSYAFDNEFTGHFGRHLGYVLTSGDTNQLVTLVRWENGTHRGQTLRTGNAISQAAIGASVDDLWIALGCLIDHTGTNPAHTNNVRALVRLVPSQRSPSPQEVLDWLPSVPT